MKPALRALGFMVGWYILLSGPLAAPPLVALALQGVLAVAFWWRYIDGGVAGVPRERLVTFRLRPLGAYLPWVVRIATALVVFDLALEISYQSLLPIPPPPHSEFEKYVAKYPLGWLPVDFIIILGASFIEEFGFRGLLQRPLERRYGPTTAIGVTALLFAAAHLDRWRIAYFFIAGVILGVAVYVTRSIWAGVILHACHNLVSVIADMIFPGDQDLGRMVNATAGRWLAPLVTLASGALLIRLFRLRPQPSGTRSAR